VIAERTIAIAALITSWSVQPLDESASLDRFAGIEVGAAVVHLRLAPRVAASFASASESIVVGRDVRGLAIPARESLSAQRRACRSVPARTNHGTESAVLRIHQRSVGTHASGLERQLEQERPNVKRVRSGAAQ